MKHVGKMKNNGAKIVIAYRTLPGDPYSALVIGTNALGETYHDALMSVVQDASGQQANELADVLAVRKFPDGNNMLEWLHSRGQLKKVPTSGVLVTPTTNSAFPLDEINIEIAKAKGIDLEDLAISEGMKPKKNDPAKTTSQSVSGEIEETVIPEMIVPEVVVVEEELTPAQLRSKADKLFKEAQVLRKQADALDPPKKSKAKKVTATEAG